MSLLTKFAKTMGQPAMGGAPFMGNQNSFSTLAPFSPGMNLGSAAKAGQNNPNPLKQIKTPQMGSATAAGIQQMAQKTAHQEWFQVLFPVPYTLNKHAEVATAGSSAPAASSSSLGGGSSGAGTGAGKSGLGTPAAPMGSQQGNQAGQQAGAGGMGGGAQGAMNGALGGQMGGQVGAFGVVRPGWNTLRPSSHPIGGVTPKTAAYLKQAMMTGAPQPVPGQTANAPMPQPGMPPTAAPQMPPPNGGAPVAQGMGQPSVDPATGQPMQPPAPGGDPAAQGGMPPGAPPGPVDPVTGQPVTSPMQDPMPPSLPANPRPLPPRAATPHDNQQNSLMRGLGHDMDMADVPQNAGEAHEDMQAEAMAMGSKTASSDAWLAFLNPNSGFGKRADLSDYLPNQTTAGVGAAAGGLGLAGAGAGVSAGAGKLQGLLAKHNPFSTGAADRLGKYTSGVGSATTPAQKMVSYVGTGHDLLAKPVAGGTTGVDLVKKFYTSPATKPFMDQPDMWGKGGKGEHFEAFAKGPLAGQAQLVKEIHGDNVERFVKPRFADRYAAVKGQIPRSAGKNWWERGDVKADVQPKFDAVDAVKQKVIAGANRSGGGAQGAFYNDAYRTVRQNDPKLFAEMRLAGVKSPTDMAKLPTEVQTKILKLFAEKSDIGNRTSREFSVGWRAPMKKYQSLLGTAGQVATGLERVNSGLKSVGRGGRVAAVGGLGLAGVGTLAALRDQYNKSGGDYSFSGEDCPKCGVSMEGDSNTGTCNSCGHLWGEKTAMSLTADEGGEDAPALPGSPMRGWQWKVLQKQQDESSKAWMPRLFKTESTPLTELLASPGKQGLLGGLAGGALGGTAGAFANKAVDTGNADWKNALIGGGLGTILGGFQAYGHRRKENDKVTDALRRTPPGATVADYEAVQQSDAARKKQTKTAGMSGTYAKFTAKNLPTGLFGGALLGGALDPSLEGVQHGAAVGTAGAAGGTLGGIAGVMAALRMRKPTKEGLLFGAGLGMLGGGLAGVHGGNKAYKSAGCMLGSRRGDKDSMSPARSASGESVDITYTDKQDQYAQGKDAWDSVSTYFKGHSKRVKQPDLAKGEHSALTKEAKAFLGKLVGRGAKPIVDSTGKVRPPIAGFAPLPPGAARPPVPTPAAGGASASPSMATKTYVPGQPPAASTAKPATTVSKVEAQVADASKATKPQIMIPENAAAVGAQNAGKLMSGAAPAKTPMGEIARTFPQLASWLKGGPRTWMAMLGLGGAGAGMTAKTAIDFNDTPKLNGPPVTPEEVKPDTSSPWAVPAAVGGVGLLGLAAVAMRHRKEEEEEKDAYDQCTDFAKGFFRRCDEMGVPLSVGVEKVGSDYGEEARTELLDGLEKVAKSKYFVEGGKGIVNFGKGLFGGAKAPALPKVNPGATFNEATAATRAYSAQRAANAATRATGSYAAGQAMRPIAGNVGRQVRPTAAGAAAGGLSGNDLGVFGDDRSGPLGMNSNAMLAGAAAFNPWARRLAGRSLGGYGAAPLQGLRTGFLGSFAGSGVDQAAGAMGFNQRPVIDPATGQPMMGPDGKPMMETANTFGSLGGKLGFGAGLLRSGAGTTASRMGANAPSWLRTANKGMVRGEKGVRDFAYGGVDPMIGAAKAVVRKPIQWASGGAFKGPSWAQPGVMTGGTKAVSMGRTAGRLVGGVGLGAGALGQASGYLNNKIDETVGRVYNEAMPQIGQDVEGMLDQYMSERGMLNQQGQFDPSSRMMKTLGGGADGIFRSMGMDPSKMSPLQKVMILGGATTGAGGALAGSPILAGMGGATAMAGLMPQFMQSQGQQRMNSMFGPQAQQQGGQGQQQPQFANRNEWQAQGGGQE